MRICKEQALGAEGVDMLRLDYEWLGGALEISFCRRRVPDYFCRQCRGLECSYQRDSMTAKKTSRVAPEASFCWTAFTWCQHPEPAKVFGKSFIYSFLRSKYYVDQYTGTCKFSCLTMHLVRRKSGNSIFAQTEISKISAEKMQLSDHAGFIIL